MPIQARRLVMAAFDLDIRWTGADRTVRRMKGDALEELAPSRDSYCGWTTEECERYVRRTLCNPRMVYVFMEACRSVAGEIMYEFGDPRLAAAYLIERARAVVAREAGITMALQERHALQAA
jgi:hypothetical protein